MVYVFELALKMYDKVSIVLYAPRGSGQHSRPHHLTTGLKNYLDPRKTPKEWLPKGGKLKTGTGGEPSPVTPTNHTEPIRLPTLENEGKGVEGGGEQGTGGEPNGGDLGADDNVDGDVDGEDDGDGRVFGFLSGHTCTGSVGSIVSRLLVRTVLSFVAYCMVAVAFGIELELEHLIGSGGSGQSGVASGGGGGGGGVLGTVLAVWARSMGLLFVVAKATGGAGVRLWTLVMAGLAVILEVDLTTATLGKAMALVTTSSGRGAAAVAYTEGWYAVLVEGGHQLIAALAYWGSGWDFADRSMLALVLVNTLASVDLFAAVAAVDAIPVNGRRDPGTRTPSSAAKRRLLCRQNGRSGPATGRTAVAMRSLNPRWTPFVSENGTGSEAGSAGWLAAQVGLAPQLP